MRDFYDTIVVGGGGMGSAAAAELARRGQRVLLLEQFPFVHDRGSSHGQSRIIRRAYFEHPAYVPLVRRSFDRWRELERETGTTLLKPSDCLCVGPTDGEVVRGVLASADQHGLDVERLDPPALRRRYPQFRFDGECGVLERDAGILFVEECVRAQLSAAARHGVTLHSDEPVISWHADDGVTVTTDKATYRADSLAIAAGPWAGGLLADLGAPLRVMRQVQLWFGSSQPGSVSLGNLPVFLADVPGGPFYGLPAIDGRGVKVARHYGERELLRPDQVDRATAANDETPVREFLNLHLPAVDGPLLSAKTCIYTLTPDRHFLIDKHPRHPNVVVAAGFSGHGFKFAPVVGEIVADLVQHGSTTWPIDLFRFDRFPKGTAP